jgi:hypothetical protein
MNQNTAASALTQHRYAPPPFRELRPPKLKLPPGALPMRYGGHASSGLAVIGAILLSS